jgi:hypothetical protein
MATSQGTVRFISGHKVIKLIQSPSQQYKDCFLWKLPTSFRIESFLHLKSCSISSRSKSVHTPESKAKISAARKGSIPWNKGKTHSKETREKISHTLKVKMADPKVCNMLNLEEYSW